MLVLTELARLRVLVREALASQGLSLIYPVGMSFVD